MKNDPTDHTTVTTAKQGYNRKETRPIQQASPYLLSAVARTGKILLSPTVKQCRDKTMLLEFKRAGDLSGSYSSAL